MTSKKILKNVEEIAKKAFEVLQRTHTQLQKVRTIKKI